MLTSLKKGPCFHLPTSGRCCPLISLGMIQQQPSLQSHSWFFFLGGVSGWGWLKENIKYTSTECGYNHKCTHDKCFVWIDGSGRIDAVPSTTVSGKIQSLSTTAPLFFQRINTKYSRNSVLYEYFKLLLKHDFYFACAQCNEPGAAIELEMHLVEE